jgi:hypothetical protein
VLQGSTLCFLVLFGVAGLAGRQASSADPYLGTWNGTWEMPGAGSGGFELTLQKHKESGVSGRVAVTGDPAYTATLGTLAFDGPKLTARYDFPPDERAEVQLTARFEGNSATGTWSLREKAGNGAEVASGTWTVKKKTAP